MLKNSPNGLMVAFLMLASNLYWVVLVKRILGCFKVIAEHSSQPKTVPLGQQRNVLSPDPSASDSAFSKKLKFRLHAYSVH
jgi:hypothetical protein